MQIKKERIRTLRETIYRCTLAPGLKALLIPRPGITKKIAILSTRYGSLDLEFHENGQKVTTPPGVAHFLEHQLFKKHGGDSLMEFSRWGASSNAFTEYTSTSYYFVCSENFEDCLGELFKLVFQPEFERSRVEREKSIIEQEILMYEDMPDVRGSRNLLQALYQRHPVRIDIAGSVETIQKITPDILYQCYRNFYNPANVVLVMAGDLDPQKVFGRAAELLRRMDAKAKPVKRVLYDDPAGVLQQDVKTEMTISRPRVMIGFKDVFEAESPEACLTRDVETSIALDVLFGRSGEFFTKHYQTGLIDDEFGVSYSAAETYGFSVIGAETDHVDRFVKSVTAEVARLPKKRFGARDVERIKRKIAGRFLRSFDSSESAAFVMLEMEQRETSLEHLLEIIKKVTPAALLKRAMQHFKPENMAVSVVHPKKG